MQPDRVEWANFMEPKKVNSQNFQSLKSTTLLKPKSNHLSPDFFCLTHQKYEEKKIYELKRNAEAECVAQQH